MPSIAAIFSIAFGFVGTTSGLLRKLPREEIRWAGFFWAYVGGGIGLLIYFIALLIELY